MDTILKEGINWVGYVDWSIRDFHGYRTEHGSTYNAYLIRDKKTVLIDTVKEQYSNELISHISELADPSKLDYVVCNHAEPDHSGSLPKVMNICRNAELVCDAKCREALSLHYDTSSWKFKIVTEKEQLSIGKRTLTFIETPMVHWPESMFTYIPEEKILFSMDAFGQHYASDHRFDDEAIEILMDEAKIYYANIVMLYANPIKRVLKRTLPLDIDIVAPSHGVIWRKNINLIVSAYNAWVEGKSKAKVMVVYDTMWKSTEKMAKAIIEGALDNNVETGLYNARDTNKTVLATEILDATAIAFGSPTLNKTLMPEMAGILTYLKGLSPINKVGFAFGSYGWSKGGAKDVEDYMSAMRFEVLIEPLQVRFVPDRETLDKCREGGRLLAEKATQAVTTDAK